jgi:Fe2+ or Zn2+ uptake regulation protein
MTPEQRIRDRGLRVTQPRVAVLGVLDAATERREHLLVAEVVARARAVRAGVSVQAVYDCLGALSAAGLVRSVEVAGSPTRYETRVGDNHHHLVCRSCARTVDVDCAVGAAPCLDPSESQGFVVDEAEVVFWGTCPDCTATTATAVAGP